MKDVRATTDIQRRLRNVYDEVRIDESRVRRWMKKFKESETRVEDKARCGKAIGNRHWNTDCLKGFFFQNRFDKGVQKWRKCIATGGDHFE